MPEDAIPNSLNEETPKPFGVGASKLGGEAAFQYVKTVIELAMQREIDATVTNAISKEAITIPAIRKFMPTTPIRANIP